jgi:hypothetical protein
VLITEFDSGDQVKEDRMDGTSCTHDREEKYLQGFGWENLKENENLEDLTFTGRIMLTCTFRSSFG